MENLSGSDETKKCFVISPIGSRGSPVWLRSDKVLRHIFSPPLEAAGYEVIRSDQIPEPGIISSQIINHIRNDDLAIADLTGYNPNVFYELAVRHAAGKPVIHVIQDGETIPFDLQQSRTIYIDISDPDAIDRARDEIARAIQSIENDPSGFRHDNPIQGAINLGELARGGNIEAEMIMSLQSSVARLAKEVADLNSHRRAPSNHGLFVSSSPSTQFIAGAAIPSASSVHSVGYGFSDGHPTSFRASSAEVSHPGSPPDSIERGDDKE